LFLKSLKLVSKHDILIAGLESTYITYFIILSGIIHNKPVIIYVHNDISNNSKLKKSFHYLLIKSLYKYCSICVSVSEGVREGIIKEIPSIGKKCKVIYNPFNIDEINVMSALPISLNIPYPFIVSSGRLEQIKRFDLLIEAHHKVLNLGIKHCLIIIGKGTCFSHLKELVSKLGVESTVYFVGFDLNPHKWVSKAFCFVLSSENEGFGNVLVESMAVGTPVISTDCPSGPSEILEQGKYGLLVENKNSEELAKAIIRMFNDQDIYNFYKLNCRERSNLYSIDKIILQWENLLTHTVKDYKF
jgi:glycosyltransferase involved in cell wall biosynthesis